MANITPPLNEQATRLVILACMAAVVALPLFGMSAPSAYVDDQAVIDASYLTVGTEFVHGDDRMPGRATGEDGTPMGHGATGLPRDALAWSDDCTYCVHAITRPRVFWHRTTDDRDDEFILRFIWFPIPFALGHGLHEYWLAGTCWIFHGWCGSSEAQVTSLEGLTQGIAEAVAAQDVAALARFANLPSVVVFEPRSAIQVRGCDGETITAHIPVNPELLAGIALTVAEAETTTP